MSLKSKEEQVAQYLPNPNPKKRQFLLLQIITISYYIIRLILLTILLQITLQKLSTQPLISSYNFKRMQQNLRLWSNQMIVDIVAVDTVLCPEGYQNYCGDGWVGVYDGCACRASIGSYVYEVVLEGKCGYREFTYGCTSVAAHQGQQYYFWKKSKHFCIKRVKQLTFYQTKHHLNYTKFSSSSCSTNQPYELDWVNQLECPLTNIENTTFLSNQIIDTDMSYQRQSNYPISEFTIAQHNFCEDHSIISITPQRQSNYILEKKEKFVCQVVDGRVVELDQQNQSSFFQNNQNILDIMNSLPSYPIPNEHFKIKLGFMRYPAWTYSCRIDPQYQLLKAKQQFQFGNQASINRYRIIIALALLVCLIFMLIECCKWFVQLRDKKRNGFLYLKDQEIRKINPMTQFSKELTCQFGKILIIDLIFVAGIVLFVLIFLLSSQSQSWIVSAKICTDTTVSSKWDVYRHFYGNAMSQCQIAIIVMSAVISADLLYFGWRVRRGDLSSYKQEQQQQCPQHMQQIDSTLNQTEQSLASNISYEMSQIHQVKNEMLIDIKSQIVEQSFYSNSPSD